MSELVWLLAVERRPRSYMRFPLCTGLANGNLCGSLLHDDRQKKKSSKWFDLLLYDFLFHLRILRFFSRPLQEPCNVMHKQRIVSECVRAVHSKKNTWLKSDSFANGVTVSGRLREQENSNKMHIVKHRATTNIWRQPFAWYFFSFFFSSDFNQSFLREINSYGSEEIQSSSTHSNLFNSCEWCACTFSICHSKPPTLSTKRSTWTSQQNINRSINKKK